MKNHPVLSFLVFTSFLVVGYTFSLRFYQHDSSLLSESRIAVTSENNSALPALDNGQRTILLIGASSLNTESPQLESIWLATYFLKDSTIHILPIFPTGKQSLSSFERQLDHSFAFTQDNSDAELDTEFINLLEEHNYWWSGYVIYDEVSLTKALDILDSGATKDSGISETQDIDKLPGLAVDSHSAYSSQLSIFQAVCHKFSEISSGPDLAQLISRSNGQFLSDLDASQLQSEWELLFSADHSPTCKFPTLEIARVEP